jgi:ankyrin repeat protein
LDSVWSNSALRYALIRLVEAVKRGETTAVRALRASGTDPNTRETQTVFRYAFLPYVVNIPESTAQPVLYFAVNRGNKEIVDLLLEYGATIDLKCCLSWAAGERGNPEIVQMLIDRGADVNDYDLEPPLMTAASQGRADLVRLLLNAGADVDARDDEGWTALMEPAGEGHKEVVELLIAAGVDVNARNNEGLTALKYATEKNQTEIVEMLVRANAQG